MPAPYSLDLRKKVIEAINRQTPILRISKVFGIARNTIYAWKDAAEKLQSLAPKKPSNGKKAIIGDLKKFEEFVVKKPDRTLEEMSKDWGGVSAATISNAMKRASFTYKKNLWLSSKK